MDNPEFKKTCEEFVDMVCKDYSGQITKLDIIVTIEEYIIDLLHSNKLIDNDPGLIWCPDEQNN